MFFDFEKFFVKRQDLGGTRSSCSSEPIRCVRQNLLKMPGHQILDFRSAVFDLATPNRNLKLNAESQKSPPAAAAQTIYQISIA